MEWAWRWGKASEVECALEVAEREVARRKASLYMKFFGVGVGRSRYDERKDMDGTRVLV